MIQKAVLVLSLLLVPFAAQASKYSWETEGLRERVLTIQALPVRLDGIPQGATRVPLLPLNLTASCGGDIAVSYVRVRRTSMGDVADLKGAYIVNGDRRLTRMAQFSSSGTGQTVTLRLKDFTVPACKTIKLDVAVDFIRGAAPGGRFAFSIEKPEDIVTTADEVVATYPIRVAASAPSVTPEPAGEVLVTFFPVGDVGAVRDETLAKFTVQALGNSHQLLESITLTNRGTARDQDLRNLYLTRHGGRALTGMKKSLDGDAVTFRFTTQFFLKKGQTVSFELRGQAYTSSKTINFGLEEESDLVALPTRRSGRTIGNEARTSRYKE